MLASVPTFALEGVDSREVTVEVDLRRGLPVFTVVGLPDAGVREARERVRAALHNSGLEFPLARITANLAPAHMRKAGPSFDLALAVGLLGASGQVPLEALRGYAVCGELSLGGDLRPVAGALAIAAGACREGYARLIVPVENAGEAALVEGIDVMAVPSLDRLVDLVAGRWTPSPAAPASSAPRPAGPDLADVRGQLDARRALEIAAAGDHNLLMIGPPGTGKTMLARRLPGIMPPPTFAEAVEITRIHSVAGLSDGTLCASRPFRAPHHTVSASGLVGGGAGPRPGEISLAHRGVLFLDELAEFARPALEAMRQPLESGRVAITRGQRTLVFPAAAMLVAACNPCPCARLRGECICSDADRDRYARRLSGPLLDRIDLVCDLAPVPAGDLLAEGILPEPSAAVRNRVVAARERQRHRLGEVGANGRMERGETVALVSLDAAARRSLLGGHRRGALSARAHDRVIRLARTIADLAGRSQVGVDDIDEALGFRMASARSAAA